MDREPSKPDQDVRPPRSTLRRDLAGAVWAAIITFPMGLEFGIIAFAPLGMAFAPEAAVLGIYAAVFCGLLASMFGGAPSQISEPKGALTLVLASAVAGLAAEPELVEAGVSGSLAIVPLAAVAVLVGGLFQILLGGLRLGNLVKYVPFPVVCQNSIVKQIRTLWDPE